MKISKSIYARMKMCCDAQHRIAKAQEEINRYLEKNNIDTEKMRNDDCNLVDFIDYGRYISKEDLEKELDAFCEENVGGKE